MDIFELCESDPTKNVTCGIKTRRSDDKKSIILKRLKQGPMSTWESERIVHRGQAVIGQLVKQGFCIRLNKIDGVDHYVYLEDGRLLFKVRKGLQDKYYSTAHWKRVSRERRALDGESCRQCGSAFDLQVHHWRYNLFSESVTHDLVTLCRSCHANYHDAIKGSGVHFPEFLDDVTTARIEHEAGNAALPREGG